MLKITQRLLDGIRNAQASTPVLVFFGDSVTQGCFELPSDGGNSAIDPQAVYHYRLQQMILDRHPGIKFRVVNAGVGGDSAPAGLQRIERDVLSQSPDFCVVCFGLNDTFGGKRGLQRYTNALGEIFTRLADTGCETVFMTPNMMNTYVSPKMKRDLYFQIAKKTARCQTGGRMDAYMDAARATAAAHGVPVCDCYARWKALAAAGMDVTEALANFINHPSREMHQLFAVELYKMMFPE